MKDRIGMADLSTTSQMTGGFYNLEANSWRWTAKLFSVTFPGPVELKTETLTLHLFVPEIQIEKLGGITLTADVNGNVLKPETYRTAGNYTFTREIPANALESNLIPVVFVLNKATPPDGRETRELGIIVTDVELRAN